MKAAVFHGPHQPLTMEQIEIDEPMAYEVVVKTMATGVCHSDLHFVDGFYPMTPPTILGHEGAGIIESCPPLHKRRGFRISRRWRYAPLPK